MPSLQALEIPPAVLALARAGDAPSQEAIYRALNRPVYALIRRLVLRPAIAEELLQDVFVEILRSLKDYQGSGPFLGWVRRIAISKSLMYLRSPWHRRLDWLDGGAREPLAGDESPPDVRDLEAALAQLTAVSRSVVWLHDVEGYTHGEIAEFFGRSVSFSKSQLARAHQQLKAHLDTDRGGLACTPLSKNS